MTPERRHLNLTVGQTTHEALKVLSSRRYQSVRALALQILEEYLRAQGLLPEPTETTNG